MRFALGLVLVAGTALASAQDSASGGGAALEIFRDRILPIYKSPKPSSCAECHLGNVDLKDYVSADPAETFASLRKEGLVDVKRPDESKLLKLIRMAPEKASPANEELRRKEYEAFRAWIAEAAKDPAMLAAAPPLKPVGPSVPDEVIRHARKDRLLSSFVENVWSERMRCWSCHAPGDPPNPKAAEAKRASIRKHGEEKILWFRGSTPEEVMDYLLKTRVLDLKEPSKSLIVTKPSLLVEHEGGGKMKVGDRAWVQFIRFIEDYAAIKSEKYKREEDLPGIVRTQQWLKVSGVPATKFVLMQVDLHRIENGRPSAERFASAISGAGPQGKWLAPVEVLVPRTSKEFDEVSASKKLPPGRYQLRFYVDSKNLLQRNPNHVFGPKDLSGTAEVSAEGWPVETRLEVPQPLVQTAAQELAFPGGRAEGGRR